VAEFKLTEIGVRRTGATVVELEGDGFTAVEESETGATPDGPDPVEVDGPERATDCINRD
jgi:hypothetical protein